MWPWEIKPAIQGAIQVLGIMEFIEKLKGLNDEQLYRALASKFRIEQDGQCAGGRLRTNDNLGIVISRSQLDNKRLVSLRGVEKAEGFSLYVHGLEDSHVSFVMKIEQRSQCGRPTRLARNIYKMLMMENRLDITLMGDENYITINKTGRPERIVV